METNAEKKIGIKKIVFIVLCVLVALPFIYYGIASLFPAKYHLAFELLDNGTYECVGIRGATPGKLKDTLEIPAEYDGKKVTSVDIREEHPHLENIKIIKIAEGIENVVLGFSSSYEESLERIELPSTVKTMTNQRIGTDTEIIFSGNSYIENIDNCFITKKDRKLIAATKGCKIPSSIESIGSYALMNLSIDELTFENEIKLIEENAFHGANIGVLKISKNVKKVNEYAFYNAVINELQIESTDTLFSPYAFKNAKIQTLVFDVLPSTFPEGEQLTFDGDHLEWYYSRIPNEDIRGMEEVESDRIGYKKYRNEY